MIKIIYNYFIKADMAEQNISEEFRLKDIDGTRNYLIEEINQNDLMSKKLRSIKRLKLH